MHPTAKRKRDERPDESTPAIRGTDIRVVIPVKGFDRAKARLAPVLNPDERSILARLMAENVIAAAHGFAVAVACDEDDVADWATALRVDVIRTDGHDLNGAATLALELTAAEGWHHLAIVHADLPLAHSLGAVIPPAENRIVMIADRRSSGTNVLVVPTSARSRFRFGFGPDSLSRHLESATKAGLRTLSVQSPEFSWDVDEPEDLVVPVDPDRPPRGWEQYLEHGLLRAGQRPSTSTDTDHSDELVLQRSPAESDTTGTRTK